MSAIPEFRMSLECRPTNILRGFASGCVLKGNHAAIGFGELKVDLEAPHFV